MEENKKIETVSCELLKICTEKGLNISDMYELSRVIPRKIIKQIELLESHTKFTTDSYSDIQE